MTLRWLEEAVGDLVALHALIAEDNLNAARQVVRILASVEQLEKFPALGHMGRVAKTRELVVVGTHYLVAYKPIASSDSIVILAVHGNRRSPASF